MLSRKDLTCEIRGNTLEGYCSRWMNFFMNDSTLLFVVG